MNMQADTLYDDKILRILTENLLPPVSKNAGFQKGQKWMKTNPLGNWFPRGFACCANNGRYAMVSHASYVSSGSVNGAVSVLYRSWVMVLITQVLHAETMPEIAMSLRTMSS